jgi:4-hydroxybenzoyl-CoA thioesterase
MEAWLTHKLAYNYAESIHTLGVGFPAVHSEADFRAPCRHGEAIVVGLRLLALGQRSFTLGYRVWGEHDCDRLRLEGKTICSSIDLREDSPTKGRALVHSEDLRARLLAFGISEWPKLD